MLNKYRPGAVSWLNQFESMRHGLHYLLRHPAFAFQYCNQDVRFAWDSLSSRPELVYINLFSIDLYDTQYLQLLPVGTHCASSRSCSYAAGGRCPSSAILM